MAGAGDERQRHVNRRTDLLITLALFFGALGLYALEWTNGVEAGKSTVGAERVLGGEIPYRDFWTMYAPGHYYLLALLFGVFGTHVLVEIIAGSIVSAAAACACYWLAYNLRGRRLEAFLCALVYLAAMYSTNYFKYLGSFPLAILLVLVALNFVVLHYRGGRLGHLAAAGVTTGLLIVFKHDVGGYTAIAIVAGLVAHHLLNVAGRRALGRAKVAPRWQAAAPLRALAPKLAVYLAGLTAVALPVYLYFAAAAGRDMLRDLIVFPMTDFRYSRPERYPSLLPLDVYAASPKRTLRNLFHYLAFALPFLLLLLGLVGAALAALRRWPAHAALGATFSVAYLFHYAAAHVQVNTHIVSMSVYGALLGLLFLDTTGRDFARRRPGLPRALVLGLAAVWLPALAVHPAYDRWLLRHERTAELTLPKASSIKLSPEMSGALKALSDFVNANVPPEGKVYIGLHRHDLVITGNALLYFLIDRRSATRYHELHPAITDTEPVQHEIIAELREEGVSLIILIRMFPDQKLDRLKEDFLKELPHIGATNLDEFVRANYVRVRQFGPYEVWMLRAPETALAR